MPESPRDKNWKPAKRDKPGVKIQVGYAGDTAYSRGWSKVWGRKSKKGAKQ